MPHLIMTSSMWGTSGRSLDVERCRATPFPPLRPGSRLLNVRRLREAFRRTQCSRQLPAGERPDLDTVLIMRPCPGPVDYPVIALSVRAQGRWAVNGDDPVVRDAQCQQQQPLRLGLRQAIRHPMTHDSAPQLVCAPHDEWEWHHNH